MSVGSRNVSIVLRLIFTKLFIIFGGSNFILMSKYMSDTGFRNEESK